MSLERLDFADLDGTSGCQDGTVFGQRLGFRYILDIDQVEPDDVFRRRISTLDGEPVVTVVKRCRFCRWLQAFNATKDTLVLE